MRRLDHKFVSYSQLYIHTHAKMLEGRVVRKCKLVNHLSVKSYVLCNSARAHHKLHMCDGHLRYGFIQFNVATRFLSLFRELMRVAPPQQAS